MIRNKFFEDPDGGYAKVGVKKNFDIAWKKVLAYEEQTGQSLDNGFTKEQYVSMFNSMRVRHTSIFFNYKSHVMSYVRYLIANGVLPAEQESILASVTGRPENQRDQRSAILQELGYAPPGNPGFHQSVRVLR